MSLIPFPIVQGMPEKLTAGITYSLCSDGIYEIRRLQNAGYVSTKVDGIPKLPAGREEIRFLSKKIPISFYWEIVRFFKAVSEYFKSNLEAYIIIGYNPKIQEYFLWVPSQIVGPASVKYDISKFNIENPGCYIILDSHVHPGGMGAFWSGTDSADDVRDRFSMVVGKINQLFPDIKVRFAAGSKHIDLELEDIFSNEECDYKLDIETSIKKVSEIKIDRSCVPEGYVPRDYTDWNRSQNNRYDSWKNKGGSIYSKKSLFEHVKEANASNFSLADLLGRDW